MKRLKIGVIGAGFIGKQHIEAIRRVPGTEVVAVADNHADMAREVAEQLAVPQWYSSSKQLLENAEIDVVHNCTPSACHYPINKEILAAGKHIYCEKPLTLTAAEAMELEKLAAEAGVMAGVNFNYRHNVMVKEMRERAGSTLGRTLSVYGEYLQDWLLYDTDYDWRMDPALGGESRAVADIGSHCFDTLQYILGKRIVAVYAQLINVWPVRKRCESAGGTFSSSVGRVLEELPISSEDMAYILIRFEDGTPGLVHVTQVCAGKKNGLAVNISGSAYSMEWRQEQADRLFLGHRDNPNEELYADAKLLTPTAARAAGLPAGHAVAWHDALTNAIASFYQAINTKQSKSEQAYADFTDGRYIMQLVEACLESSRTGQWIELVEAECE